MKEGWSGKLIIIHLTVSTNTSTCVDFLDAMAKYLEITGLNPKGQVVLSPAEELKKFRDTIVSFMRKQENDFIKPTFGKMDTLL